MKKIIFINYNLNECVLINEGDKNNLIKIGALEYLISLIEIT